MSTADRRSPRHGRKLTVPAGRRSAVPAGKGMRGVGLVLAVLLVGCTVGRDEGLAVQEQVEHLVEADGRFVGMSQEALRNCAGAPDERFGTDQPMGLEQWVYHVEPPGPAAPDRYCQATFSLKNGQVTNAVFTQRNGMRVKDLSKCSALIVPCRQGERH